MKPAKIVSLQGLRALAACLVVLYHIRAIQIGNFGVDIFFVISGFVISLVAEVDGKYFLAKRLFRVVPLYWLATLGAYVMAMFLPDLFNHPSADIAPLLKSLFFIPYQKWDNMIVPILPQGWTLNYEMFFYVIFAAVLFTGLRRQWIWAAAAIIAIVGLHYMIDFSSVPLAFWTDPLLLEFVAGLLLHQVWVRWRAGFAAVSLPVVVFGIVACLTALSLFQQAASFNRPFIAGPLALALVTFGLCTEGRIKLPQIVVLTGDASYSLYLLHVYVLVAFEKMIDHFALGNFSAIALIPVESAVCITLAICSYKFVERPSNRWLRARLHTR
jgi:exopolysaccharide production protein ExoZ